MKAAKSKKAKVIGVSTKSTFAKLSKLPTKSVVVGASRTLPLKSLPKNAASLKHSTKKFIEKQMMPSFREADLVNPSEQTSVRLTFLLSNRI